MVPNQIIDAIKLEEIHLNDNQLDELPDISSLTSLNTLNIHNNLFTFEDIEPNINISNFSYSPQDSVGAEQDTTITEGESLNLPITAADEDGDALTVMFRNLPEGRKMPSWLNGRRLSEAR